MKLLHVVLTNLVTVALALVVYDQFQGDPPSPTTVVGAEADTTDLEPRLAALEADRRRPRRPAETEPEVLARLAALEAAVRTARETETDADAAVPSGTTEAVRSRPTDVPAEPALAEIERFRRLREAVRRQDAMEKSKQRVEARLDALRLGLTVEQRAKVHAAYAAFQPRVGAIWAEAKTEARRQIEAGVDLDRSTFVADTTAVIQQEFAASLTGIVAHGAAEAIAAALLADGK